MAKVFSIITLLLCLASCAFGCVNANVPKEDDNMIADKTVSKIISAITSQDSNKIGVLFSKSIQEELNGLQENALEFLEFVQGDIISVSVPSEAGIGVDYKIEKGKKRKEIQVAFSILTTEAQYYIAIKECTMDEFEGGNIGVTSIYIIDSRDWTENYIYRGDGKWNKGINIEK